MTKKIVGWAIVLVGLGFMIYQHISDGSYLQLAGFVILVIFIGVIERANRTTPEDAARDTDFTGEVNERKRKHHK